MNDLIDALFWAALLASLVITVVGLVSRAWERLLVAAVLSLVCGLISLGIGPLVLLLTDLQLAAAVALRWSVAGRFRAALLLIGALAWMIVLMMPMPLGPAAAWLPVLGLVVPVVGIILTLVGPRQGLRLPAAQVD